MGAAMTIGELAERTGFTPKAIRFYERIALLPPAARKPSGYRFYGTGDVARLDFIAKAKRLGLSLEEIRGILALRDAGMEPCVHVVVVLDEHLAHVDRTITDLEAFRAQLRRIRADARRQTRGHVCGIIERVPDDLALSTHARLALGGRRNGARGR